MPRPTTKAELLYAAATQFDKLFALIDTIPEEHQNDSFNFDDELVKKEAHWNRDQNLRDVFAHLYEWHQLILNWVKSNQNGEDMPFLPAPYNWKTYGQMNVEFFEKHQSTAYDDARKMLIESHEAVLTCADTFTDETLFTKGALTWTGGSTLGSYFVSATSSHYDWAIKKIKRHIKNSR